LSLPRFAPIYGQGLILLPKLVIIAYLFSWSNDLPNIIFLFCV
jgi:hypothetical protein